MIIFTKKNEELLNNVKLMRPRKAVSANGHYRTKVTTPKLGKISSKE